MVTWIVSSEHGEMCFANMEGNFGSLWPKRVYAGEKGDTKCFQNEVLLYDLLSSESGPERWEENVAVFKKSFWICTRAAGFQSLLHCEGFSDSEQDDTSCSNSQLYLVRGDNCTLQVPRRLEGSNPAFAFYWVDFETAFWYLSLLLLGNPSPLKHIAE